MNRNVKIAIGAAAVIGILFFARRANAGTLAPQSAAVTPTAGGYSIAPNVLGMSNPTGGAVSPIAGGPVAGGPTSVLPDLNDLINTIFHATAPPPPAPAIVAAPMPAPAPAPVVAPVATATAPSPVSSPYVAPAPAPWVYSAPAPAPSNYVNNTWVADGNGGYLHGGD